MDYNEYLEKYCKAYRTSLEASESHAIVKEVKRYYEEIKKANKGTVEPHRDNCNDTNSNNSDCIRGIYVCDRAAYQ